MCRFCFIVHTNVSCVASFCVVEVRWSVVIMNTHVPISFTTQFVFYLHNAHTAWTSTHRHHGCCHKILRYKRCVSIQFGSGLSGIKLWTWWRRRRQCRRRRNEIQTAQNMLSARINFLAYSWIHMQKRLYVVRDFMIIIFRGVFVVN